MRPVIIEERVGESPVKFPSFIEFNKSGTRIRIAFDGADPDGALDLIEEGLAIRSYGINAFMASVEKMAKEQKV